MITDLEKSILFEVSCMDIEHLCITFEMVQDRGMASFELDFSDLRNVQSKMHKMSTSTSDNTLTDVNQGYLIAKAVFDRYVFDCELQLRVLIAYMFLGGLLRHFTFFDHELRREVLEVSMKLLCLGPAIYLFLT